MQVAFKKPEFLTCLSRDVGDVRRPVKVVGEKYTEISLLFHTAEEGSTQLVHEG